MVEEKLKGHDLFALMTPKEVESLSSACRVASLKAGQRVYSEGIPASHLCVLLKGKVELRRPAERDISLLVEDVSEGGVFGVSSLAEGERYLLNAECVEDSEVLMVESRVLRSILDQNPVAGYATERKISQIFFKRYVMAMERLRSVIRVVALGLA
jgi:signal-transduction protein with cAMP-binding, CBS, and nucleotidyltransferase domain